MMAPLEEVVQVLLLGMVVVEEILALRRANEEMGDRIMVVECVDKNVVVVVGMLSLVLSASCAVCC